MAGKVKAKARAVATRVVHVGKGALKKAESALASTRARLAAVKKNAGGKGMAVEHGIATIGGGAASGALQVYLPEVAGFDSRIPVGAGLFALGLFGPLSPRIGGDVMSAAAGMLACVAEDMVEDALDGDDDDDDEEGE